MHTPAKEAAGHTVWMHPDASSPASVGSQPTPIVPGWPRQQQPMGWEGRQVWDPAAALSAGGVAEVKLLRKSHHIRAAGLQEHSPWCSTPFAGRRERHGDRCIQAPGSHWGSFFSRLVFFSAMMRVQQILSLVPSVGERGGVMGWIQGLLRSISWAHWLGGRKKCQRNMRDSRVLPPCHHAALLLLLLAGGRIKSLCGLKQLVKYC